MPNLSLNQIVSLLSDTVGQPFDVPLQKKLKAVMVYKRANYTQQFLEKHPEQRRFFQQTFTSDLVQLAPGDVAMPTVTVPILRTKCKIPPPLRSQHTLFDFVGSPDWTRPFGEVKPEFNSLNKFNRYSPNLTKWAYFNDYIYVFNNLNPKKLGIRSVFANPEDVNGACSSGNCYSDDMPFPIAADVLNAIIRDTLNVEIKQQFPQPGVTQVPENKDTERPMTT